MLKKISLLILGFSCTYAMHTAELNINEYDLEAGLKLDIGQFNEMVEPNTTFIGIDYLKADRKNSSHNNIDRYVNINFMIEQEIQNSGFKVGLGVKGIYTGLGKADFRSLPIGAEVSYKLPLNIATPIGFKAEGYYAPKSLSFSDANGYVEYRAEAYIQLMDRASVYVGYRRIDTEYDYMNIISDVTYNKSIYSGIKFSF
ncbi:hypothetical protein FJR48_02460 [Sulfurimonas lithotrophica]|uniref:Outer membrane protein beta-barrel domain-containing protein n=1 Tax=Sulfurimonas lithotrophica TaxID=2590022 RepID=A0A5P8NYX7_9BACT|nr:YfaZ family outer membrane protein [Sulfurimonas lithotrophica]QFR48645.1 hypothetical protein FJR48_02460 [Sulfurimonas lithotrophica]